MENVSHAHEHGQEVSSHKRSHTGFLCMFCQTVLSSQQELDQHLVNTGHAHRSEKSKRSSGSGSGQMQQDETQHLASCGVVTATREGHHACNYCNKKFTSVATREQHESHVHQRLLESHGSHTAVEQEAGGGSEEAVADVQEHKGEQFMLNVSSSVSESLCFYMDGKIMTSTVSGCEVTDVHVGSLASIQVEGLMLDSVHESNACLEAPGSLLAQPGPETTVSSSVESPSVETTESREGQKQRPVFPFEKLKQLLKKQVIPEGQSASACLSAGRFKRRTGSPQGSSQQSPSSNEGPLEIMAQDCVSASVDETLSKGSSDHVTEQPVDTSSADVHRKSCYQQPLDLSNSLKRVDAADPPGSALDLSLQRTSVVESEFLSNLVLQAVLRAEGKSNSSMFQKAPDGTSEPNLAQMDPEEALLPDLTLVTGPEMTDSGLVYGLALPSGSLTRVPPSLSPAPPGSMAFAPTALHSVLTVLTPSSLLPNPSNQPIQVLASNISPEPIMVCTEPINPSECDLSFPGGNPTNLVTLSQPLDPSLNHVFLTDQPVMESSPAGTFPPSLTLNDSLVNSYNLTSNTVLIECTIALDANANMLPPLSIHQNLEQVEQVEQVEQEPLVSLSSDAPVEPSFFLSSTADLVSSSAADTPDCPAVFQFTPEADVDEDSLLSTVADPPSLDPSLSEESTVDNEVQKDHDRPPGSPSFEKDDHLKSQLDPLPQTFTKNFVCNVCDLLFHSMKELSHHVGSHAHQWPFKCEFCVLLFEKSAALLDHRSSLHGVGKTYVCSVCVKDFVFLSNLKQHQEELHPGKTCSYSEEEKGKLRPQNYNTLTKVSKGSSEDNVSEKETMTVKKEEDQVKVAAEELLTTIKILAAQDKAPDVRLGINQHYPSYKPPPFPYHNRSPAGSTASATNFTTHNIPQTFSTAIRCTKCGKSFDNMPELHKHILACANASDKRRYTPKKNPIPLRHFAKSQNGVLATTNSSNEFNASNRASRSIKDDESGVKDKLRMISRRKKKLLPNRNKSMGSADLELPDHELFLCPRCGRDFTLRRSRTKHMAVCLKKSDEAKTRKESGISLTKENDRRLQVKDEQTSSPHKTRLQTSGPAKRAAVQAEQDVVPHKKSPKNSENPQPNTDPPAMSERHGVRTFHPAMRQYSRMRPAVKESKESKESKEMKERKEMKEMKERKEMKEMKERKVSIESQQDELRTGRPGAMFPSSSKQSTTA